MTTPTISQVNQALDVLRRFVAAHGMPATDVVDNEDGDGERQQVERCSICRGKGWVSHVDQNGFRTMRNCPNGCEIAEWHQEFMNTPNGYAHQDDKTSLPDRMAACHAEEQQVG